MPGSKFNLWKTVGKILQSFGLFLLPQLGNVLGTLNPTDGSILGFITHVFPKLDPTIGMVLSALILGAINALKHWDDGKTK